MKNHVNPVKKLYFIMISHLPSADLEIGVPGPAMAVNVPNANTASNKIIFVRMVLLQKYYCSMQPIQYSIFANVYSPTQCKRREN